MDSTSKKSVAGKGELRTRVTTDVGKRVRKYRLIKDLTQEQLGFDVGCGDSQISHIENGDRDVDTELLFKIAKALDVTPADLLSPGERTPSSGGSLPASMSVREADAVFFSMPGHISAEEREKIEDLLRHLGELPSDEKDLVYELIETIFRRKRT